MSTFPEEIFSDGYLDAFYKAHVAASRRSSLDDDIAAIEAEIRKVEQVRNRVQSYRVATSNHLNSCGNSECSDDEEVEANIRDVIPTSVFKVYNSTTPLRKPRPKGPDVFSWALHQVVNLDHNYCGHAQQEAMTPLDHDDLTLSSVFWHQCTAAKRSLVLRKLCTILRQSPTNYRKSPSHSPHCPIPTPSLSLLPHSLAETLRNHGGLGVTPSSRTQVKSQQLPSSKNIASLTNKLSTPGASSSNPSHSNNRTRKKPRHVPYDRRPHSTSRRRNVSTCSEGDDHIEID